MQASYQAALAGTLVSQPGAALPTINFYNKLPCAVVAYLITSTGLHQYLGVIFNGQNASVTNACNGDYYLFNVAASGGFVCVIEAVTGTTSYTVTNQLLVEPNDIGPIPQPTKTVLIPPNTPPVVVACGVYPPITPGKPLPPSSLYVVREQFWSLQGDSYSLAPNETRTISYTVTSGKQTTSSNQVQVSTSLGMSASAGWGPVSAGVSASLNASASVFQQVTVTEQSSTYVSSVVKNEDSDPVLALRWQMVDLITIFNQADQPQASIASGSVVLVKTYTIPSLPAPQARPAELKRDPMPVMTPG